MTVNTENNRLTASFGGARLIVEPWGESSVRVRMYPALCDITEDERLSSSPYYSALTEQVSHNCTIRNEEVDTTDPWYKGDEYAQYHQTGTDYYLTNGKLTVKLDNEGRMSFYNQHGEVLTEEYWRDRNRINRYCVPLRIVARELKPRQGGTDYEVTARFEAYDNEKIFGMGQYQDSHLNKKGSVLELCHRNSQASVPFYISSRGYGFLWNNPAVGTATFGTNKTEWYARSARYLDYFITAGDTPAEITEHYTAAAGRAPRMPEFGLGYWQCKLRYYNQEQVLSIAREYKKRNIPLDVIVIDFYHWPYCGDWRFDEEFFPDPAAMIKELQELGVETMVSIWPAVDFRSENYEEMKQQNMLVKSNSGVDVQMIFHGNNAFMDATNPKTRRYVWEKCKQNYADLGIRTFWLDVAEPEYTSYDFENYRYYSGTVLETGNIYPREYARLFYEGQKENGQDDIVNLIRCAWAGSQRYGALVWSGDIMSTYEDFRKQICAGIHMGLSGIPWWTTDIGGFHNGVAADLDFKELLIRWFQFGTFCPVMRLHGSRQPYTPIYNKAGELREGTGTDNEVWSYGEEAYQIMTKFIHVRELMRDYTRSLMQQAHENGHPVLRALFYEFPSDPICWDIKDSYLFGSDLLVAPICHEHAVDRQVYLPAGASWTDARTGIVYEGGQWIMADAPMDTLPVFLRDGRQDYLIGEI